MTTVKPADDKPKDIFGRPFSVPVDAEHKATLFTCKQLTNCSRPHMHGFWAGAIGFFCTFFSAFAAAPLGEYITPTLGLTKDDKTLGGILAVSGTVIMRFLTGPLCEKFGARRVFAGILLGACPGIIWMMCANSPAEFIACRFIIGLGLATFVTCQVWASQLFAKSVVGAANATAAGWGNLGGGVTQLVMPQVAEGFIAATGNEETAWRMCFGLPLIMHLLASMFVLWGRDLPDGNFKELEMSGAKQASAVGGAAKVGFSNVNAWILLVTYGFCFGVELTMNNIVSGYFTDYHGMYPSTAGALAACFGMMNLFARSWGGLLSDWCASKWGMRGRLWSMWIIQVLEGCMCVWMACITLGMRADFDEPGTAKVDAFFTNGVPHNSTVDGVFGPTKVGICGSKAFTKDGIIVGDIHTPNCVRNNDSVGYCLFVMIMFSTCVQMAEGLHFGVVPYVSRPALGIVSGMVGAGGNIGAVLTGFSIFKNDSVYRTDSGILYMGCAIIGTSLLMFGLYFPEEGGLLFGPGGLGSYDPQIIKPAAGARGADMMDYSKADPNAAKSKTADKV